MLKFIVQGSKAGGYEIIVAKSGIRCAMSCSCEAGLKGTYCKHRFALLSGDVTAVISGNGKDLALLYAMIAGTNLERIFNEICKLEQEKETVETKLKSHKKAIAREMSARIT